MDPSLLLLAGIGFFGNTVAVIIGAVLQTTAARRAQSAAVQAQLATTDAAAKAEVATAEAQKGAADAQTAAARAAAELVRTAQATNHQLSQIDQVTKGTHAIVNNQKTMMLALVAELTRRIAIENPNDSQAARAAAMAEEQAAAARKAQDQGTGAVPPLGEQPPE